MLPNGSDCGIEYGSAVLGEQALVFVIAREEIEHVERGEPTLAVAQDGAMPLALEPLVGRLLEQVSSHANGLVEVLTDALVEAGADEHAIEDTLTVELHTGF